MKYIPNVRTATGAGKADDNGAADVLELKQKRQEVKNMAKTIYTDEQINEAVELAKKVGIHAAGTELGIPWQSVQSFCKKAGVMEEASKKPAKKAATPKAEEKAEKKSTKKSAKKAVPAAAPEDKLKDKPAEPVADEKPKKKKAAADKPAEPAPATDEKNELAIENAVLRKENEQLKAKIEKLQKALADLI